MFATTAVIFSNTQWTFWNVFLLFFLWIPLMMLWFFAIFDVFRRSDLSGIAKALWVVAIIIFPWIGTLVYLIARPKDLDSSYGGYYGYRGYGYGDPYYGYGDPRYSNPPAAVPESGPVPSSTEPQT